MTSIVNVTTFFTFFLIVLGAIVHNTSSALSCPDWPLCYGALVAHKSDGALIEQSHRLLASFIGFLSLVSYFLSRRYSETHPQLSKLAGISLFLVVLQGIFGATTFFYKLPTIASVAHLTLSLVFLCSLVLLSSATKNEALFSGDIKIYKKSFSPALRDGLIFTFGLVFLQIFLGAMMRHSGAGKVCELGANLFQCLDSSTGEAVYWSEKAKIQLHLIHRYSAFVLFLTTFWYAIKIILLGMRENLLSKSLRIYYILSGLILLLTIIIQLFVGMFVVKTKLNVTMNTVHLVFAIVLLITMWKLILHFRKIEKALSLEGFHTLLSDLLELTKARLGSLVVMTILIGVIAAPQNINFFEAFFAIVLCSMVVMGATTLNCYIERDIDKNMERTKQRALPAGRMQPVTALVFGLLLLVISLPLIWFYVNMVTCLLALTAVITYLFMYTPLKLKSEAAVFVGAIPGAIPPVMGWTLVTGRLDEMAVILFLILFVWQIPHFIAISMYHADDYRKANILVYPNTKGFKKSIQSIFSHTVILMLASSLPFLLENTGPVYRNSSLILNGLFLLLAFKGFFTKTKEEQEKWARSYFIASIIYLPLLLASIIFFH